MSNLKNVCISNIITSFWITKPHPPSECKSPWGRCPECNTISNWEVPNRKYPNCSIFQVPVRSPRFSNTQSPEDLVYGWSAPLSLDDGHAFMRCCCFKNMFPPSICWLLPLRTGWHQEKGSQDTRVLILLSPLWCQMKGLVASFSPRFLRWWGGQGKFYYHHFTGRELKVRRAWGACPQGSDNDCSPNTRD